MSGASLLAGATLFEVSPLHVDEGERIGFLHEDKAVALGRLIAVDGQRDPIKVVAQTANPEKPWRLVTGMHRLIGARIEGLTVWAIEVAGAPEDLADLESSENLHRRPLAPLERAKFVHALCDAAMARLAREHGDLSVKQRAAKARWDRVRSGEVRAEQALQEEGDDAADNMSSAYGWQESAADALGMDKRTIRRALQLYRLVVEPFPDLVRKLADHPIVGENAAQLKAIADVRDEGQRRAVIEQLLDDSELSADEARVRVGIDSAPAGVTPVKHQKFYSQIEGGWQRLGLAERRAFLPNIASMLHTPELKRSLRDRLSAELGDDRPRKVGVAQAADTLHDVMGALNRLLEGTGVDDEELTDLRRKAQAVIFDIEETPDAR